jgi:hypothetical protein
LEQSEVETLVGELETRVERLRSLYDQYFMGIERCEPSVPRKDVERRLYVLRRTQIRNTGLRFRFQNALLRYNTYQTYWIRICRQIEEGTYKRDLRRANARFAQPVRAKKASVVEAEEVKEEARETELVEALSLDPDDGEGGVDVDVDFSSDGAESKPKEWLEEMHMRAVIRPIGLPNAVPMDRGGPRRNPPPLPPPRPGAAPQAKPDSAQPRPLPVPPQSSSSMGGPSPEGPPRKKSRAKMARVEAPKPAPEVQVPNVSAKGETLSDERVRQIYGQYVDAKRSRQESTASLTYENLAKSLRDSSDKLRQKHSGKSVDFEVAVKDGKTILRPIVK